jgi:phage host-nuclease inhibitor protein Gam
MPTPKRKAAVLESWTTVDEALVRLCSLDIDRRHAESQMNAELAAVKLRYSDALEAAQLEDVALRAQIEQFAREHQAEFSPQKTVERLHGILSLRTTPPAVKVLMRKWSSDERFQHVVDALGPDCIRTTQEIAKDIILAKAAAGAITKDDLSNAGLRISQHEDFSLDLKYEHAPKVPAQA